RRARAVGGQRGHPAPVERGGLDGGGRAARCRPGRAVAAGGAGALRTGRGERRGGTVMSGRIRLTLAAWGATLLAACALLPLVRPATWLMQAAFLLAVQAGVGAAARRVPLPRFVTVAAQLLVTLSMLTLVFAREHAFAGLIPGLEAIRFFAELLESGGNDVSRYAILAPLSDGIRLILVGGVLVIWLLVDTLAVNFRRAAPAGLPLLALYSVAAGLSDGGSDWL